MSQDRWEVVNLADIEGSPLGRDGTVFKPVRRRLNVLAFGINAYEAERDGVELIHDHDELSETHQGHEELYVVLDGHATFKVDGESVDAPRGTVVAVHDPAARRSAIGHTQGTAVLAIGGTPGAAFCVSAWEYTDRAFTLLAAERQDEAVEAMSEARAAHPDHADVLYNSACVESLVALKAKALAHLRRAIELEPEHAKLAVTDDDLAALRGEPGFPTTE